jgi:very-short-patch-repair endonuclease
LCVRGLVVEESPFEDLSGLDLLRRVQCDVVSRRQALRQLSPGSIKHLLATGRWRTLHRGVYLTRQGPHGVAEQQWCALLVAGYDRHPAVCLGGVSALNVWGLRRITPTAVDVLIIEARKASMPTGSAARRTRHLPGPDQTHLVSPPATLPARSLVDAAARARSDREASLIVAACFQQRLLTLPDLQRESMLRPNAPRRVLLLSTAEDCAGGSHSLGELDLIQICRRFHLPRPSRQVRRKDRQGRTRYLDALFEEYKVVMEIDGVHHLDVDQMWDDAERQNALTLDGYTVLRFPASMVRNEPARVAAAIREALMNNGWRSVLR